MKKKLLLLLLLLIVPTMVSAKTVKCTTTTNFRIGEDPYEGLSVSCTDGTDTLKCSGADECVKNNNFKLQLFSVWGSNAKAENYHNMVDTDQVKAGETYAMIFSLTYNFADGDKLIVDGEDQSAMMMSCDYGCSLMGAERSPKAGGTTAKTTKKTTTEAVVVNVYWVNFNLNGGTGEIANQAVEEGKPAKAPETTPTREGYKFVEWQLDGKKYDFNTKITKTIELKAKWAEDATGKKKISFINLTNFSAPYSGNPLDTQVTVETNGTWNKDKFSVDYTWYRGKSKDKLTEKVESPYKHKAEDGYYYQAVITITPGAEYTVSTAKVKINGKLVTPTKDENKLVIKWNVYGPVKKGENLEPRLVIKDEDMIVYKNDALESFGVYFVVDHSIREDIIVEGDDFIKVSNTVDFKAIGPNIKGTGRRNVLTSSPLWGNLDEDKADPLDGIYELGRIGMTHSHPGVYETDVYFTDVDGREYRGHIRVTRKNTFPETVKLKTKTDKNAEIQAEILAAMEDHWMFNFTELVNKDMGQITFNNGYLSELGTPINMCNISITNDEDGELTNAAVTLKIPLTDEIKKYKNHSFIYVSQDIADQNKLGDTVHAKIEGDFLVVRLPHLSTWMLVGKDETTTAKKHSNTLVMTIGLFLALTGILICALSIILNKKKKDNKKEEPKEDSKEDKKEE